MVAEVKKITDKPIEIVYDAVSNKTTKGQACEITAPGGTLILVLAGGIDQEKVKDKHIVDVVGNVHTPGLRKLGVSLYGKLTQLLADGDIKVLFLRSSFIYVIK